MKKRGLAALLLFISMFLLAACSVPFDEAQKEAQTAVEETFKKEPPKANKENDEIKYYVPSGVTVESEEPSNILLTGGGYEYRLFYNPLESEKSRLVYEVTQEQRKYDVKKSFENQDRFGFLLIKKLDDKESEIVVGVGGVKVKSKVKTKDLAKSAAKMMEIACSVQMK